MKDPITVTVLEIEDLRRAAADPQFYHEAEAEMRILLRKVADKLEQADKAFWDELDKSRSPSPK